MKSSTVPLRPLILSAASRSCRSRGVGRQPLSPRPVQQNRLPKQNSPKVGPDNKQRGRGGRLSLQSWQNSISIGIIYNLIRAERRRKPRRAEGGRAMFLFREGRKTTLAVPRARRAAEICSPAFVSARFQAIIAKAGYWSGSFKKYNLLRGLSLPFFAANCAAQRHAKRVCGERRACSPQLHPMLSRRVKWPTWPLR